MVRPLRQALAGLVVAAVFTGTAHAQWLTESYTAKAGWNAVWVGVDCTHTTLDLALASKKDILEVWRWNPAGGPQFVTNPATPVQQNPAWNVWRRGQPLQSTLFAITGNAAYLIKVTDGAAPVTFSFQGRPLVPNYDWATTGINLVGLPVGTGSPTFSQYFGLSKYFTSDPTVLAYGGGALSATAPKNPYPVLTESELLVRGSAYWVQATQYVDYSGPIAVTVARTTGLNFGREQIAMSLRLKNVTNPTKAQTLTVTLTPTASDTAPAILLGSPLLGSTTGTTGRVVSIVADANSSLTYATPPVVTLTAPAAGTTATAIANLDGNGRIASFTVVNGGAGYGTTAPTLTVTPTITGRVPLKVRGAYDPVQGQYAYTNLGTSTAYTLSLTPGQETEVILVADRAAMGNVPGALFASFLRITDSLGYSRIDLPVTAVTSDFSGLWTGVALINQVSQIAGATVKSAADATGTATVSSGGVSALQLVLQGDSYVSAPTVTLTGGGGTGATAIAKVDYGLVSALAVTSPGTGYTSAPTVVISGGHSDPNATASQFPLRLIVHRATNGETRLVQQAYLGSDGVTPVLATAERLFPTTVTPSSRLSSSQLPSDLVNLGTGALAATGTVTFSVVLDYNSDSNPFVHRYHPDHDNLDDRYASSLAAGKESLTVRRAITLTFQSSLAGVNDPAWGSTMLGGTYREVVSGLRAQSITSSGTFVLYRVAAAPTLLTP